MKRLILLIAIGLLAVVSAHASYKIYLTSGEVITADDKPVVKEGLAFFKKAGLPCYLAVDKVDMDKSEKNALSLAAPPVQEEKPAAPVTKRVIMRVNDEGMEEIRKRVRLANEDELGPPPESGEGGQGAASGGMDEKPAGNTRAEVSERLKTYQAELANAESERNQARLRLVSLLSQYNMSSYQDEKDSIQGQMNQTQQQLNETNQRIAEASAKVQDAQAELFASPVTVEVQQGK